MGGRGGFAVGAVVVAPGTSSSVGRVLGNRWLVLLGVLFFILTLLRKLYGGGCCTEPSEK